jgi:hypothetical protein
MYGARRREGQGACADTTVLDRFSLSPGRSSARSALPLDGVGRKTGASAVSLLIGYAKLGDPAALFDLGLLCLLRGGDQSETWAQSLFVDALKNGAQFATPALMRLHAIKGEALLLKTVALKALEQAQYLPSARLNAGPPTGKSANTAETDPGIQQTPRSSLTIAVHLAGRRGTHPCQ